MIQVIVLLEVMDTVAFQEFEMQSIRVMRKYGGKLLAAFEPDENESSPANIAEIHYLQFPDIASYKKYQADPQLAKLSVLREKAISNTAVFVSGIAKVYEQ